MSPIEVASLRALGRLAGTAPRAAQVPPSRNRVAVVTARFVARAHQLGVPVHVWTINDRPEMERLLDLGVDGIMTDETELLRDVFSERGHWSAP
jgi:glycerophosphoryl diester phosphodiesterase